MSISGHGESFVTWGITLFTTCGIRQYRNIMDLYPKSYASAADGSTATVMTAQAHTGVTVLIATNACKDAMPRCHCIVFFFSNMLHFNGKSPFLLCLLQPLV